MVESKKEKKMKNKNIVKSLLGVGLVLMAGGCSSDYLEVNPETQPNSGMLSQSVDAAKLAVRGIANAMQTQYSNTSYNQYCGESYINTMFGDCWGSDVRNNLYNSMWGTSIGTWQLMGGERYVSNALPWNYYYNLIFQANGVLDGIDSAEGDSNMRMLVKGQALCYRAHAYIRLLQFYAPRWEDSNNGEKYCIVLRTNASTENVPLAKMIDVKNQIYADLDSAVSNMTRSTADREFKWEPNLAVAQGLYARAALVFHDWKKAQEMAHAARAKFQVMDNKTAFAGFYTDNSDFMWEQAAEPSDIYYWSWGSHYSCNGKYVESWGDIGAGYIGLELYNELDPNDIRRGWFITPDKITGADSKMNPGGLTMADFWDKTLVNASNMDMSFGPVKKGSGKYGLANFVVKWGKNYMDNTFTGNLSDCVEDGDKFACYYSWPSKKDDNKSFLLEKGVYATLSGCMIGSQYKFWSLAPYGCSNYPFMRASEMCLAEAEAAYMAGDYATAQKCLTEINGQRITGYTGGKSGQALLDEIRLCRRIELWGEGQNWTDLKRWKLPCVRNAWVEGKPNSGNCPATYAMDRGVDVAAGWRFTVPASESDYNNLIDRSLLPSASEYNIK